MIRVLAFDVFGTVVDWYGSIVAEGNERWAPRGFDIDWGALAVAWRKRYQPSLERVRSGEREWTPLDVLHRESLEAVLPEFGLERLSEDQCGDLNLVWHRLRSWPDARAGLGRLADRYRLTTLSNGNRALLEDLVRFGDLPMAVLSAEDFGAYKPDPRTYLGAAERLGVAPAELMMVAAHADDLEAASSHGLATAYVWRPLEWGPDSPPPPETGPFDVVARDFVELAEKLGP